MHRPSELRPRTELEQQIAALAYKKWQARGCPMGDGSIDWFAARAEFDTERERLAYEEEIAAYD